MSSDELTAVLRVALMLWAATGSIIVCYLFRRSHDTNPIPWAYLAGVLVVYAINMATIVAVGTGNIAGWWRPVFSVLNINVIVASLWVIWRAVGGRCVRR